MNRRKEEGMDDLRVFDSLHRVRLCLRYQQSSNLDLYPVDDLLALPAALRSEHPMLDPVAALGAPLAELADVVDKRRRGRVRVGRERHGHELVVVRDQEVVRLRKHYGPEDALEPVDSVLETVLVEDGGHCRRGSAKDGQKERSVQVESAGEQRSLPKASNKFATTG